MYMRATPFKQEKRPGFSKPSTIKRTSGEKGNVVACGRAAIGSPIRRSVLLVGSKSTSASPGQTASSGQRFWIDVEPWRWRSTKSYVVYQVKLNRPRQRVERDGKLRRVSEQMKSMRKGKGRKNWNKLISDEWYGGEKDRKYHMASGNPRPSTRESTLVGIMYCTVVVDCEVKPRLILTYCSMYSSKIF